MITLTTPRLLLRELVAEDAGDLYLLNTDPEVLRYTGDAPFASIEEAREFIRNYHQQYIRYQCGRLAMIIRATGEFAGWCGLKYHPDKHEYDLGFRLKKAFWNKGLATEAAKACIHYGFTELKLSFIVGRAEKEHAASLRVLEKVGMQHWQDFDFEGRPGVYMRIDRKDWEQKEVSVDDYQESRKKLEERSRE